MQYYCAQCGRLFNTVRVRKYCDECRELAKRICNNMYSMGYCRNKRDKEREMSIYATNECISGLMDQLSELTKKRDALKAEVERLSELDKLRCEEIQRLRASEAQSLNDWQNIRAENERLRKALEECRSIHGSLRPDGWYAIARVLEKTLGEAGKEKA